MEPRDVVMHLSKYLLDYEKTETHELEVEVTQIQENDIAKMML